MIYVDPFYLAVITEFADGNWHSVESVERALLLNGFRLHETCRVGAIMEAEIDDPESKTEKEARANRRAEYRDELIDGRRTGLYRLNAAGLARFKQLAPAKPVEITPEMLRTLELVQQQLIADVPQDEPPEKPAPKPKAKPVAVRTLPPKPPAKQKLQKGLFG